LDIYGNWKKQWPKRREQYHEFGGNFFMNKKWIISIVLVSIVGASAYYYFFRTPKQANSKNTIPFAATAIPQPISRLSLPEQVAAQPKDLFIERFRNDGFIFTDTIVPRVNVGSGFINEASRIPGYRFSKITGNKTVLFLLYLPDNNTQVAATAVGVKNAISNKNPDLSIMYDLAGFFAGNDAIIATSIRAMIAEAINNKTSPIVKYEKFTMQIFPDLNSKNPTLTFLIGVVPISGQDINFIKEGTAP
jgi:hypothetical protein